MVSKPIDDFLNACIDIFNKFENDPLLDGRLQSVAKILKNNGQTLQMLPMISIPGAKLLVWAQNVVKYSEVFRKNELK
jgi:hypothetical protein